MCMDVRNIPDAQAGIIQMKLSYIAALFAVGAVGAFGGPAVAAVDYSSQAAQVTQTGPGAFTFTESGFAGGGTVTGSFTGSDLDSNGQLSSFAGEVTGFGLSFSGNATVAPFSLNLSDLQGLVYNLNGGPLGDESTGVMEGILAQSGMGAFAIGPGPLALCNGQQACASVSAPSSSAGVPEPAAWTLMIMGFGLAGLAVRRRQPALAL